MTRGREVGVDIEEMRALDEMDALAQQVFSDVERQVYRALAPADRVAGFFTGWTRKEAFVKAHGDGLSRPLSSFDVALGPGTAPLLLADRLSKGETWTMYVPYAPSGFAAALVISGPPMVVVEDHLDLCRLLGLGHLGIREDQPASGGE
jgi:4'-phosphopantetheinyl transferase